MVWTILQVSFRRLKNNRSELLLSFAVPILFFSIFALIFGSRGTTGASLPRIKVALSDQADSAVTKRAIELLREQSSLRITDARSASVHADSVEQSIAELVPPKVAEDLVRRGSVSAAVVFSQLPSPAASQPQSNTLDPLPSIQLLSDSYDQVSSQVMSALVQKAVMTAFAEEQRKHPPPIPTDMLPGNAVPKGPDGQSNNASVQSVSYVTESKDNPPITAPIPPPIPAPISGQGLPASSMPTAIPIASGLPIHPPANFPSPNQTPPLPLPTAFAEPPRIETIDVLGGKKNNPVIAMYAAGIAVMFLLFSATTASGSLLEERENSTLDRLLCSRLTMDQLLMGKWMYLTIVGIFQMVLMFTWGSLVFGIELWKHLEGFIALTVVTAGASSSFALFLASLCRTRTQLGWVSTIVILSMSALGGSMVPRYLMSESMQRAGMLTFNAWALEGFNKIFWRELRLPDIELELGVLTLCGFCFIVAARLFAVRWERT